MAWAPKYGLKGQIDASVRVKIESNSGESHEKVMPLEFKSGKVPKGQARIMSLLVHLNLSRMTLNLSHVCHCINLCCLKFLF